MGALFKAPKAPELRQNPEQERLVQRQNEEIRGRDSEIAERRALRARLTRGRRSLISGSELGIPTRQTLG